MPSTIMVEAPTNFVCPLTCTENLKTETPPHLTFPLSPAPLPDFSTAPQLKPWVFGTHYFQTAFTNTLHRLIQTHIKKKDQNLNSFGYVHSLISQSLYYAEDLTFFPCFLLQQKEDAYATLIKQLSPGHSPLSYIMQYKVIAQNRMLSFTYFFQYFNCSANILVSLNCSFLYLLIQNQALQKIYHNQLHFHSFYSKTTCLDSLSRTYGRP